MNGSSKFRGGNPEWNAKLGREAVRKQYMNYNEAHTCPYADRQGKSLVCQACMRGESYGGFKNVSARRCFDNPISPTGERYILRATHRKDSDSFGSIQAGQKFDVADYMSEHAKVQLVKRMQAMGRELYLWSNGHVDITPEPDSNS